MVQPLWEKLWQFLIKLNIYPPADPAIPLPRIYPIELKTHVYKETRASIFTSSTKLETTQVSINRRMDKQMVEYS